MTELPMADAPERGKPQDHPGRHNGKKLGKRGKQYEIDHTDEISQAIAQIGFEFEVRSDVLRIWGYLPKSYEDFPPA